MTEPTEEPNPFKLPTPDKTPSGFMGTGCSGTTVIIFAIILIKVLVFTVSRSPNNTNYDPALPVPKQLTNDQLADLLRPRNDLHTEMKTWLMQYEILYKRIDPVDADRAALRDGSSDKFNEMFGKAAEISDWLVSSASINDKLSDPKQGQLVITGTLCKSGTCIIAADIRVTDKALITKLQEGKLPDNLRISGRTTGEYQHMKKMGDKHIARVSIDADLVEDGDQAR